MHPTPQFLNKIDRAKALAVAKRAEEMPLNVYRSVRNAGDIIAHFKEQGLPTTVPPEELHVTIIYSRTPVDWLKMGAEYSDNAQGLLRVPAGGPRIVERLGPAEEAVVLSFRSSDLEWRHQTMIERGAEHSFDAYRPHVTITFNAPGVNVDDIEPWTGPIVLGPEMFEPINDNFKETLVEKVFAYGEVIKADQQLGLVFGWAIVCKENGEPYVDLQDHHIPESAMLRATTNFMKNARVAKEMHQGEPIGAGIVHSFPLTADIAKAMGIKCKRTGWMVAMEPSREVFQKFADGTYKGFSIGGFFETED